MTNIVKPAASPADIDTLARTAWAEARGEGQDGMCAVAAVIANRAAAATAYCARTKRSKHPLFGDGTLASACTVPWQFSCWNSNDPNRSKLLAVTSADPQFAEALTVAAEVAAGTSPDPTGGATHYLTQVLLLSGKAPPWALGRKPDITLGRHAFFRGVD